MPAWLTVFLITMQYSFLPLYINFNFNFILAEIKIVISASPLKHFLHLLDLRLCIFLTLRWISEFHFLIQSAIFSFYWKIESVCLIVHHLWQLWKGKLKRLWDFISPNRIRSTKQTAKIKNSVRMWEKLSLMKLWR